MGLSLRDPPSPPRNVFFFASPMGNQRLQRRLLGTRWPQMLIFNSNAGGEVVEKTLVQGVVYRVLESTTEAPVAERPKM